MDTKTALLDAAEALVRAKGYDGFSYADLADAIGIRKASIHYHFPKKSDLGLELMRRYGGALEAQLQTIDETAKSGGDRLKGQIKRYRSALVGGDQMCLCVALSVSRDIFDDALIGEMAKYRSASVKWMEAVFAQGAGDGSISGVADPKEEAWACLAVLEGAHLSARAERSDKRFDEALKILSKRIR